MIREDGTEEGVEGSHESRFPTKLDAWMAQLDTWETYGNMGCSPGKTSGFVEWDKNMIFTPLNRLNIIKHMV